MLLVSGSSSSLIRRSSSKAATSWAGQALVHPSSTERSRHLMSSPTVLLKMSKSSRLLLLVLKVLANPISVKSRSFPLKPIFLMGNGQKEWFSRLDGGRRAVRQKRRNRNRRRHNKPRSLKSVFVLRPWRAKSGKITQI